MFDIVSDTRTESYKYIRNARDCANFRAMTEGRVVVIERSTGEVVHVGDEWLVAGRGKRMSEVTAPVTVAVQIDAAAELAKALKLRDQIKAAEEAFKERLAPYKEALRNQELLLQRFLNDTKQDTCTVRGVGVVYKTTKHSFTVEDIKAFRRAVIGGELWDFVDWKVNPTQAKDTIEKEAAAKEAEAKGEPVTWNGPGLPEGVKHTTFDTVGLRKAAATKKGE